MCCTENQTTQKMKWQNNITKQKDCLKMSKKLLVTHLKISKEGVCAISLSQEFLRLELPALNLQLNFTTNPLTGR